MIANVQHSSMSAVPCSTMLCGRVQVMKTFVVIKLMLKIIILRLLLWSLLSHTSRIRGTGYSGFGLTCNHILLCKAFAVTLSSGISIWCDSPLISHLLKIYSVLSSDTIIPLRLLIMYILPLNAERFISAPYMRIHFLLIFRPRYHKTE